MPGPDPDPWTPTSGPPSDELVLAAVERAWRHRARDTPAVPACAAVPVWSILEHLALAPRSAGAGQVRSRLSVLHAAGWLERSRRHGVPTWALTSAGRGRLQQERRAGAQLQLQLPESPQHRAWRQARTAAARENERLRANLRERLGEAALLLKAEPPPHSDAWFELGHALQHACRCVGSASHCLYEWDEPRDLHADVDEQLDPADERLDPPERARRRAWRAGRRNARLWDEGPAR